MTQSSGTAKLASRVGADLAPRVVSGVALAGVAVIAIALGGIWIAALVTLMGLAIAWEWGRVVRDSTDGATIVHALAVLGAVVLWVMGAPIWAVIALAGGAALVAVLSAGHQPLLSAFGVAYAGVPALALLWLRADQPYGLRAVGYLVAVVVATDTAAYFAGRLIGGPKLWPAVSPNKTWSGLIGGMTAAALVGAATAALLPSGHMVILAIGAALLAVIAQAGDMAESALKRRFGVKDASGLIPGHGGVMDRADGLIAAVAAAALFALAADATAPARALLIWS